MQRLFHSLSLAKLSNLVGCNVIKIQLTSYGVKCCECFFLSIYLGCVNFSQL